MAQNPALTQLLTDLNAAPHPGMGNDFFAHVGSHMALARTQFSLFVFLINDTAFLKFHLINTTSTLDARKTPFWWRLDLIAKISPSSMRAAR